MGGQITEAQDRSVRRSGNGHHKCRFLLRVAVKGREENGWQLEGLGVVKRMPFWTGGEMAPTRRITWKTHV
jgi:hypothetical protein